MALVLTMSATLVVAASGSLPAGASSSYLAGSSASPSASTSPVPGSALAPIPGGAANLGRAPAAIGLEIDIALQPRDPQALASFASAVSTPGSPSFRHFLPPGQLASEFGPAPTTISAVESALKQAGLTPGPISANDLLIPVKATVSQAEAAFHTPIDSYRLASGQSVVVNTQAPRVPTSVAPDIQAVIGLDTVPQQQPAGLVPTPRRTSPPATSGSSTQPGALQASTAGPQPCSAATATATKDASYTANQLATAYSFGGLYGAGDFGQGATVAIFELEPYLASDISAFQACYHTSATVTNFPVDGFSATGAGSGEAALDIENVIEMAPKANIDVYEAPDTGTGIIANYNAILTNDTAQVVSTSWGACEAYTGSSFAGSENTIFQEMAAQGQTVVAASGDTGSEGCLPNGGNHYAVSDAADPAAVAVDSASGTVYVANQSSGGAGTVSVLSESTLATVATVDVGTNPDGIAFDSADNEVYVTNATSPGSVSVIPEVACNASTQSGCTSTTITAGLGDGPAGIAVNPTGDTIYVANKGSGTVSVLSGTLGTVVATVTLGTGTDPVGVSVDSATGDVYVTDSGTAAVSVIAGSTCNATTQSGCTTIPPTIAVGSGPEGVVVNPTTDTIYVANNGSNSLSVIDGSTGTVSTTVTTNMEVAPIGVALSPSGGQILVTGTDPNVFLSNHASGDPTVAVVSASTDKVTTFLATGQGPEGIAVDPSSQYAFIADSTGSNGTGNTGNIGIIPLFLNVGDPASQPYVTGVGGTDLTAPTSPPTETAWGDPLNPTSPSGTPYGASTGGISTLWPMPAYQDGVAGSQSSGTPCGASSGDCREVPDVSASGAPSNGYVVYYNGAWTAAGGTSGAAPLWAALIALTDAGNTGTLTTLGSVNADLYRHTGDFYPVTSGNNDYTTTNGGKYAASSGYNMVTGLGTPKGSALAAALNPSIEFATQLAVTTQPPSSSTAGTDFTVKVSVEDASGAVVSSSGAPVSLAITSGTGTSGAALACTTNPVDASSGVASFSCSVNDVGSGYTLTATSSGLTSAVSSSFAITSPTTTTTTTTTTAPAPAPAPTSPTPPPAPSGSISSASGTSSSSTGTATATNDGTTASASGVGALTVAQYASDPVGSPSFSSSGEYFDVALSSGNAFTGLTVKNCNLNGGNSLQWWNPSASGGSGAWEPVTPTPTYSAGPPACVSAVLTSSSSPSLAQMTGTVLAVSSSPPPSALPPSVTTGSATSLTTTSATLNGTLNPNGAATSYDFEYGTTTAYGSKSPTEAGGSGTSTTSVAANLTGLSPATTYDFRLVATNANGTTDGANASFTTPSVTPVTPATQGYWETTSGGDIYSFGNAKFYGSTGNIHLNQPIVAMASNPVGGGYWLVARDGGVFSFGTSRFYGSLPGLPASEQSGLPVVAMAATANGGGYWEVTSGGDVYSFGDAKFYGSTGKIHLNQPIVAMAAMPGGGGYWLVARDGGIFAFGKAGFDGSLPGLPASEQPGLPVVAMASTPFGHGYYEVTTGGDIYSFGDAHFYGSTGNLVLNQPIVGMAAVPGGGGYRLVARDGGIFAFGSAGFEGSLPGLPASEQPGLPVVAMARS